MSNLSTGKRGEELAAQALQQAGYEIVARNWRCRYGEVDIIAKLGGKLCFVEVKARRGSAHGAPQEAVNAHKRGQIAKAAACYLAENYASEPECCFISAAVLLPQGEVELIEDFLL
ncbi:MAG: YraN family protein [Firmicutes bacterium]|nr:YraN family protein [Bacillota bacterium]MBQ6841663.1 YraN family protein [Bacillota bacterium]MBR6824032.1 YraN family protein [Bacillota bacterium]MBR7113382.1 YraN family protein [Bacillota bacterium]